jgi:hypothetical protein
MLTFIQEMPDMGLSDSTATKTELIMVFFSTSTLVVDLYLTREHNSFLSHTFQFVVHLLISYSVQTLKHY